MKIAITCNNNEVFQHFGHTPEFAIFEIDKTQVISKEILNTGDSGHGALATLLADQQIELLICGNIGPGAINALKSANIQVIGGANGNVDDVAAAFANNTLTVRANFHCNHHHNESHSCSSHSSEGHSCGSHDGNSNHSCSTCKH
jgi:predicted Fe-Mo cluster-binding NifX family protein